MRSQKFAHNNFFCDVEDSLQSRKRGEVARLFKFKLSIVLIQWKDVICYIVSNGDQALLYEPSRKSITSLSLHATTLK